MAMIQCPSCGEQISDRAVKCVHCGYELTPHEKKICVECGAELAEGETVCHSCGCPVDAESPAPQQVEVTGVKIGAKVSSKNKKLFIGIAVSLVVVIVAIIGIIQIQKRNAAEAYSENLKLVSDTMLSGAAKAETCGNLINQVWYNAIYEKIDFDTDQYTRPDGDFVSDFNTALRNLFSDEDFKEQIQEVKDNQTEVQLLMKKLKNPPSEYEDAYEAVSEYYDAYIDLTDTIINPTGSLQTFHSNFDEADSETMNCYKAMLLYLD